MDIIQGNKVVAEYMGYTMHNHGSYKTFEKDGQHIYDSVLQYHSDWNWFMPAYNKFRSEVTVPITWDDAPKEIYEKWEKLEMSILTCDIKYAFELLVELINWKNNKS